jgi:hypothetical protein
MFVKHNLKLTSIRFDFIFDFQKPTLTFFLFRFDRGTLKKLAYPTGALIQKFIFGFANILARPSKISKNTKGLVANIHKLSKLWVFKRQCLIF